MRVAEDGLPGFLSELAMREGRRREDWGSEGWCELSNFSLQSWVRQAQKLTAQGTSEPQERGYQDPKLGPRAAHGAADCGAQGRGIKGWRSGEHPWAQPERGIRSWMLAGPWAFILGAWLFHVLPALHSTHRAILKICSWNYPGGEHRGVREAQPGGNQNDTWRR